MSKQTLVKTKTSISVGTKIGLVALMLGAFVSFGLFAMLPMKALDIDGDGGGGGGSIFPINIVPENTCWESDGGDPYVFGTTHNLPTNAMTKWFTWRGDREVINYDECSDYRDSVFEMTCDDSVQAIPCPFGCFEGRCTYEYETCPAGWYCDSPWIRVYKNSDCMVVDKEWAPDNTHCVNGQFEPVSGGWDWTNSTL